jgi:spermidine synthase
VIEAGKKYFPTVAAAWDDKRVTLECGDGAVFLNKPENEGKYDVIITVSRKAVADDFFARLFVCFCAT